MKTNHTIYKACGSILMSLLLLFAYGCTDEAEGYGNGQCGEGDTSMVLTLQAGYSTGAADKTRALSKTTEASIDNISVLVFRREKGGAEGSEKLLYQAKVSNISGGNGSYQATIELNKSTGDETYSVAVVANCGTDVGYALYGKTKGEVQQALLYDSADRWPANLDGTTKFKSIPMWGESAFGPITDTRFGDGSNKIEMQRALARFDVGLNFSKRGSLKAGDIDVEEYLGLAGYSLQTVHVYRTPDKGCIVPAYDATSGTAVLPSSITYPHPGKTGSDDKGFVYNATVDGTATQLKSASVRDIYVPENNATPADKATCIVVGIKDETTKHVGYYRMIVDTNKDGNIDAVVRNHRYVFSILSVTGEGQNSPEDALNAVGGDITYTVQGWDDTHSDVWVSGQYRFEVSKRVVTLHAQASDEDSLTFTTNLPAEKISWAWSEPRQTDIKFDMNVVGDNGNGMWTGSIVFHSKNNNTGKALTDALNFRAGDIVGQVDVTQSAARMDYYVDCTQTNVYGTYLPNQLPDPTDEYVELTLTNISADMLGLNWEIETVASNAQEGNHNLHFKGSGTFTQLNEQTVTLLPDTIYDGGNALGLGGGLFSLTLKCNNKTYDGTPLPTPCDIEFTVGFKKKQLLASGLSQSMKNIPILNPPAHQLKTNYAYGGQIGTQTGSDEVAKNSGGSRSFLHSDNNFSLKGIKSAFPVNGFEFTEGFGYILTADGKGKSYQFFGKPGDIAILGGTYLVDKKNDADGLYVSEQLQNYVNQGGVLIIFDDYEEATGGTSPSIHLREMGKLFDDPDVEYSLNAQPQVAKPNTSGGVSGGSTLSMDADANDPIMSGKLGGVQYCDPIPQGTLWGVNWCQTMTLDITEGHKEDFVVYSKTPEGKPVFVRYKKKNIIWIGCGGFLANYGSSTNDYGGADVNNLCPYAINPDFTPKPRLNWPYPSSKGNGVTVHNSEIFRNIMAWAIYQAEFNGANSGGLDNIGDDGQPSTRAKARARR
ncbi:MAG: hypothetical protein LBL78_02940 [Prevotellaceae bacterium]|nr:hypothetical protein [Prevotellaceae bacterium]